MLDRIKEWIQRYYDQEYTFDNQEFLEIMNEFAEILPTFQPEEIQYISEILQRIIDRYTQQDYYYVMEIFEYEFVPLFID